MTDALTHFVYHEQHHQAPHTLFLLHGTGGNEHDLFPLTQSLSENYNLVGLRGNVLEQGMPRFFKRLAEGIFDMDNMQAEAAKLAAFLTAWSDVRQIPMTQMSMLGYSNGANMILATLFQHQLPIQKAVLLHPMLPFEPEGIELNATQFLLSYGQQDPLVSEAETHHLIDVLRKSRAQVEVVCHGGGHELQPSEVAAVTAFLAT